MERGNEKAEFSPRAGLYPSPLVLVTSVDAQGRPNIITLAWAGIVCSEPPQLGISIRPGRYSYELVKASGEFTVNVPSEYVLKEMDQAGMVSGREVSKFALTGLTSLPAKQIKPPLIAECPVNLECVVRHRLELGSHDLFVGEVVAMHASRAVVGEKGRIDYGEARPIVYLEGQYWSLGSMLARHGFSQREG